MRSSTKSYVHRQIKTSKHAAEELAQLYIHSESWEGWKTSYIRKGEGHVVRRRAHLHRMHALLQECTAKLPEAPRHRLQHDVIATAERSRQHKRDRAKESNEFDKRMRVAAPPLLTDDPPKRGVQVGGASSSTD